MPNPFRKDCSIAFFAVPLLAALAGCYSIETATTAGFRNSRILGIDGTPVGHSIVSNYGWFFFDRYPILCGNPDRGNGGGLWRFFSDQVTLESMQGDLTREAARRGCELADINFYRESTCMLPIPYVNTTFGILWYREVQVSGVLVKPNGKEPDREAAR